MLTSGFKWRSIYGAASAGDSNALAYNGTEVARMSDKVGGGWLALLRYPDGRTVHRECTNYAAGRAGIEAWAERHQDALIAHCEERDRRLAANRIGARG